MAPVKAVGHRRQEARTWMDSLQLQRTLAVLRGTGALLIDPHPKNVADNYRDR